MIIIILLLCSGGVGWSTKNVGKKNVLKKWSELARKSVEVNETPYKKGLFFFESLRE